ncbi:hypothetical protein AVEN_160807-1 [Araneus ventricosus]|uniref:Uncharacterized protein n=1 Tax=Araneus ventricosus TaxID=182803 RepID=A0A4Y2UJ63_ARAVE|nr:hypothetical protein AVEN_160807-1 [Araneus ventricosus]
MQKKKERKEKICHCALSSKNTTLLAKRDSSAMLGACGNNKISAASVCCNNIDFVQEFLTFQGLSGSIMSHSCLQERNTQSSRPALCYSFKGTPFSLVFMIAGKILERC